MLIREEILNLVKKEPGISAYQISMALNKDNSMISSVCLKLVQRGILTRIIGIGPRNGYGYFIPKTK